MYPVRMTSSPAVWTQREQRLNLLMTRAQVVATALFFPVLEPDRLFTLARAALAAFSFAFSILA